VASELTGDGQLTQPGSPPDQPSRMSLTRMTLISMQHHRRGKPATAGRMSRPRRWMAELIKRRAFFGYRASRDR
jgi:hypothetical protein